MEKTFKTKTIALIGFMGSGKSAVARILAEKLKRKLFSTDELIEKKEKRTIADIFTQNGEASFRRIEKEILAEIVQEKGCVIDCGGGIILDDSNRRILKENCTLFYLKSTPDVIYKRIKDQKKRPLLNVPDPKAKIEELLKVREPLYKEADVTINSDGRTPQDMAEEILKVIKE